VFSSMEERCRDSSNVHLEKEIIDLGLIKLSTNEIYVELLVFSMKSNLYNLVTLNRIRSHKDTVQALTS